MPLVELKSLDGDQVNNSGARFLFLAFLCASCASYAHADFPLQMGNTWQFTSTDVMYPLPALEVKVVGDTVLQNGKRYARLTGIVFGASFLRQELSKVYAYDVSDSAEYVLFDFAARPGDTLSTHAHGMRTIIMTGIFTGTPVGVTSFSYREMAGLGPGSYGFYDWTIRDSMGLVSVSIEPGTSWQLSGALINGVVIGTLTGIMEPTVITVPGSLILLQSFPNPFNPSTTIRYGLPSRSYVMLTVFNTSGQQISILQGGDQEAGYHEARFDATGLPSGVYFYRMQAGSCTETKKFLLLR